MPSKNFKVSILCHFYIALVLDGLMRLSGLFMWELLQSTNNMERQNVAFPFTFSWAVANIMSSFSDGLLKKHSNYVKLVGVLLTATGAALCMFTTNIFVLVVSWGFIFGSGYGLSFPHLSRHLRNVDSNKFSFLLQATSSLGVAIMPFILHILISYYGLPGSYLMLSGIILNYLPLCVATAYNIELSIPNIKWKVRKRSSHYYVSKQYQGKAVSNESFINSLEPDLILKISQSDGYEDEIKSDRENSDISAQGVICNVRKISETRCNKLQALPIDNRMLPKYKTDSQMVVEIQSYEKRRSFYEGSFSNNETIYEEVENNEFRQCHLHDDQLQKCYVIEPSNESVKDNVTSIAHEDSKPTSTVNLMSETSEHKDLAEIIEVTIIENMPEQTALTSYIENNEMKNLEYGKEQTCNAAFTNERTRNVVNLMSEASEHKDLAEIREVTIIENMPEQTALTSNIENNEMRNLEYGKEQTCNAAFTNEKTRSVVNLMLEASEHKDLAEIREVTVIENMPEQTESTINIENSDMRNLEYGKEQICNASFTNNKLEQNILDKDTDGRTETHTASVIDESVSNCINEVSDGYEESCMCGAQQNFDVSRIDSNLENSVLSTYSSRTSFTNNLINEIPDKYTDCQLETIKINGGSKKCSVIMEGCIKNSADPGSETVNETLQTVDKNSYVNQVIIDKSLKHEEMKQTNKDTKDICSITSNLDKIGNTLVPNSDEKCDISDSSKCIKNKTVVDIPLDIKVHVVECTLMGDEENWFQRFDNNYLKPRKDSYRKHSNSMMPGMYDNIDFTTLNYSKNDVKCSDLDKPETSNVYSISENTDLNISTLSLQRTKQENSQLKYTLSKMKPCFKFLYDITTPICICIILITMIFEINLVTLITIFADFGNDVEDDCSDFKLILVAFGIGGLIGKFCCCKISKTIPEKSNAIGVVLFLLTGLSIAGILFSPNFNWLATFYCILGALEGGISYTIPKFIQEYINKDMHSKVSASKSFVSGMAIMSIPYLIGLSRDQLGDYEFLLQTLSCSSVLCAFLVYFLPHLSKASNQKNNSTA